MSALAFTRIKTFVIPLIALITIECYIGLEISSSSRRMVDDISKWLDFNFSLSIAALSLWKHIYHHSNCLTFLFKSSLTLDLFGKTTKIFPFFLKYDQKKRKKSYKKHIHKKRFLIDQTCFQRFFRYFLLLHRILIITFGKKLKNIEKKSSFVIQFFVRSFVRSLIFWHRSSPFTRHLYKVFLFKILLFSNDSKLWKSQFDHFILN